MKEHMDETIREHLEWLKQLTRELEDLERLKEKHGIATNALWDIYNEADDAKSVRMAQVALTELGEL